MAIRFLRRELEQAANGPGRHRKWIRRGGQFNGEILRLRNHQVDREKLALVIEERRADAAHPHRAIQQFPGILDGQ